MKIFINILFLLIFISASFASQSLIIQAEGVSALGDDKTRKETECEAREYAKRDALEKAGVYIESETTTKNFVMEKDLVEAYSRGTVKIVDVLEGRWFEDPQYGLSYEVKIQAEVIPDLDNIKEEMNAKDESMTDDPRAPLSVTLWTDKDVYKIGDRIKIFIKGNKPFFGKVVHKDNEGNLIQILPNPYRKENYFNGGIVYELPSGTDTYVLDVTEPIGSEEIILYASTKPLGQADVQDADSVFIVTSKEEEMGVKTRGIRLSDKNQVMDVNAGEFFESSFEIIIK